MAHLTKRGKLKKGFRFGKGGRVIKVKKRGKRGRKR